MDDDQVNNYNTPVDWDSPNWGKPGYNVHHATTDDVGSTKQKRRDDKVED